MDLHSLSDEQLLTLFKEDRTPGFFAELVRRHEQAIIKKCYQHLKNREDAQDVAQEVLLRPYTKSHTYKPALPFKPWLEKIIQNRCIDHLKKDKTALNQEVSEKIADSIEEEMDTEEVNRPTIEILRELLETVGGDTKLILVLKYEQGWSIQAIQQALGLTESAVKQRLKRSREKIQKLFAKYSDHCS